MNLSLFKVFTIYFFQTCSPICLKLMLNQWSFLLVFALKCIIQYLTNTSSINLSQRVYSNVNIKLWWFFIQDNIVNWYWIRIKSLFDDVEQTFNVSIFGELDHNVRRELFGMKENIRKFRIHDAVERLGWIFSEIDSTPWRTEKN